MQRAKVVELIMSSDEQGNMPEQSVWVQVIQKTGEDNYVDLGDPFQIVPRPANVSHLREKVKEKAANNLAHVDANELLVYRLNNEVRLPDDNHAIFSMNGNCTKLHPRIRMESLQLREDENLIVVAPKPQQQQQQQVSFVHA